MHGVITTYDSKKGTGRIQGDDGFMYFFDLELSAHAPLVRVGLADS